MLYMVYFVNTSLAPLSVYYVYLYVLYYAQL